MATCPNSLPWLRPFALTGNIALDVPTQTETMGVKNPDDVFYGFAIEYSIPYLQEEVRDVGLGPPFNRLIPLVEFALTSPFNRGYSGTTTGTVQPGVIWAGQYFQVGAEAIIPTNSLSGHGIGGVIQLHFYLDDLFPQQHRPADLPMVTHRTIGAAAVFAAAALGAPAAQAHAFLDHASPAVGSSVPTAPAAVTMWFTQQLEPAFTTATVTDQAGNTRRYGPGSGRSERPDRAAGTAEEAVARHLHRRVARPLGRHPYDHRALHLHGGWRMRCRAQQ